MKLCMANGYFHPFIGGTEKHMFELGRRLARTEEVHVVTSRLEGTKEYEVVEGMKVHRLKTKHVKMPVIYPPPLPVTKNLREQLGRLDAEHGFEVFNLHGRWFPHWNEVAKYARKKGKMMVQTLHNQRPYGISPLVSASGMVYEGLWGKPVLRGADWIISVSEGAKRDIMKYGLDGDRIKVIHNGVDVNFYKPSAPTFREKYADGYDHLLVFVGRIIEQKGLRHLYDAMPRVLKEHPRTRILIVGKGKLRERHMELVRRKGLEKNVLFPGFIPDEKMPDLYSSADIFVLPSLWEPFGFVLVEAGSCGTPLCGSDVGGIPEIIERGKNGLTFPSGDPKRMAEALESMLGDERKLREMGKNSREIAVERFDWEVIARKTREFYEKAIPEFHAHR